VAVWQLVRRRTPAVADRYLMSLMHWPAVPIEAPGLNVPYSSLDPTAPTKRLANRTRVDGVLESE